MPTSTIPGKQEATRVQIIEPSRDLSREGDQVIDEFVLAAGESREYDFPTASTGYKYLDAVGHVPPRGSAIPAQPPGPFGISPQTQAEMDAGSQRLDEAQRFTEVSEAEAARAREEAGEESRRVGDRVGGREHPQRFSQPDPRDDPDYRPSAKDNPLHPQVRGEGDKLIYSGMLTDRPLPPLPTGVAKELAHVRGAAAPEPAQRHGEAEAPSLPTGTTGHADWQAELEGGQDGEDQRQAGGGQSGEGPGAGSEGGEGQLVGEDGSRGEEVEEHDEDTPRRKRRKKED